MDSVRKNSRFIANMKKFWFNAEKALAATFPEVLEALANSIENTSGLIIDNCINCIDLSEKLCLLLSHLRRISDFNTFFAPLPQLRKSRHFKNRELKY